MSQVPYSNTNRGKVRRHMKSHLDSPKPWVCATCRKSFAGFHLSRQARTSWHRQQERVDKAWVYKKRLERVVFMDKKKGTWSGGVDWCDGDGLTGRKR